MSEAIPTARDDAPTNPVLSAGLPAEVSLPGPVWRQMLVVMERMAASSDLGEVLGVIIDSLRDCLNADRASVFQYDKARHELFAEKAHGVDNSLRFSADAGLAGEAVRSQRIVCVPDCYADARFNREIDRRTGYRTRCMLSIPLISFDGDLEGVAQVLNKGGREMLRPDGQPHPAFDATDEAIARGIASQAAVAIRRARLLEAERLKNKMQQDLRVAREVQQSTLPAEIPQVPGYSIAGMNKQADETGGDTYDVMVIPQPAGPARLLIVMADATGHGIGPALSVTQVHAMLRMGLRLEAPLEAIVANVNAQLAASLPPGLFVTAFVGLLDTGTGVMSYVAAGQAPVVVYRADGTVEERDASAPPLAVDPILDPDALQELTLHPGDAFVLLSDGYYELRSPRRTLWGLSGVNAAVKRGLSGATADDLLANLTAEAAAWAAGVPPDDDQTAVIVRRAP
jgi:sigma-B regulation protein RsbU (phosphoserine phosphatase)